MLIKSAKFIKYNKLENQTIEKVIKSKNQKRSENQQTWKIKHFQKVGKSKKLNALKKLKSKKLKKLEKQKSQICNKLKNLKR